MAIDRNRTAHYSALYKLCLLSYPESSFTWMAVRMLYHHCCMLSCKVIFATKSCLDLSFEIRPLLAQILMIFVMNNDFMKKNIVVKTLNYESIKKTYL